MPNYRQAERPLTVTTPLGPNELLLVGLRGEEGISKLFRFEFSLLAENATDVSFDKLLGQRTTAAIHTLAKESRYISGIISSVSQGHRDQTFTEYRVEVVPQFWLLTRRRQSRIFQYLSVPDILKKVLTGLDVTFEIQGTFLPREYCVQYRESDFDFASRLMEEEGIYYFFEHTSSGHTLVLANTPQSHPEIEPANVIYEEAEGGNRPEERIYSWRKTQNLRSGKTTLWDHSFELPGKNLEASKSIVETIRSGQVNHKFKVGGNDKLEIYDYPGEYANTFDGVGRGGGDTSGDLQNIFEDNTRIVDIRMQEEAAQGLSIRGDSSCPRLTAGYRFTLDRHFNADGTYVLTDVEHRVTLEGDYRSADADVTLTYDSAFTCIPLALPFRPERVTEIPRVYGAQTAVVVGPAGEEIFTDKYSRVKVQFPWDREGKNDGNSSCWVRVATYWAGKQWGAIHIPRIGQEVVIEFVDGDVDHPIIVGSVYNAEQMPPYSLPANKTQSGIKSRSSLQGTPANFNEIRFEDKKGSELLHIHAEKDQSIEVENDESHWVGHDRTKTIDHDETTLVKHDRTETVDNNETITIHGSRTETVDKDETITIHGSRTESVDKNESISIGGSRTESVSKDEAITIGGNRTESVGKSESITIASDRSMNVGKNETVHIGMDQDIKVGKSITLTCGPSSIQMDPSGITIKAMQITIKGEVAVSVDGVITKVNAGAILKLTGGVTMIN
jgi:type VI secretion system secreted protein VgrG